MLLSPGLHAFETRLHVHYKTVEEVREIHREGMAKRQQIGGELAQMRDEVRKRMAQGASEALPTGQTGSLATGKGRAMAACGL